MSITAEGTAVKKLGLKMNCMNCNYLSFFKFCIRLLPLMVNKNVYIYIYIYIKS